MQDSVFTKIIKGELPCNKVYEDSETIVIIPIEPVAVGHVLVIPKMQVDQFFDLPNDAYLSLMKTVKKVAKHMKEVLQTKRVGVQIVGLDVPHVHIHVLAFNTIEEFHSLPDPNNPVSGEQQRAMAETLRMEDQQNV